MNLSSNQTILSTLTLCLSMLFTVPAYSNENTSSSAASLQAELEKEINWVIADLKNATDFYEYKNSNRTTHDLFHAVRENPSLTTQASLCMALNKLNDSDLALFDNEISSDENLDLLTTCEINLKFRIKNFYTEKRKKFYGTNLEHFSAPFSLKKFNVIERPFDTTKGQIFEKADLKPGEVILTFDDGPHETRTYEILATLKAYGAKAMFFSQGQNAKRYPEILKQVSEDSHSIGSHSYSHPQLAKMSLSSAWDEIVKGHSTVFSVVGWIDPFFRFPYASTTRKLDRAVRDAGVSTYYWNIDTLDWKTPDPEELYENTINAIKKENNRGIILMHDVQQQTSIVLPRLLQYLIDNNFTLYVLIPQDLNVRTNNPPLVELNSNPKKWYDFFTSIFHEEKNQEISK